jgi:hypothetical protein
MFSCANPMKLEERLAWLIVAIVTALRFAAA